MDTAGFDVYTFFNTIARVYLRMRKVCERELLAFGVTYPQFGVLSAVYANPGVIQKEVGDLLHTDTTTVMVICDSLENKGLITRVPSKKDRRAKTLVLTTAGQDTVAGALPVLMGVYQSVLDIGGEGRLSEALQTLTLVAGNLARLEGA